MAASKNDISGWFDQGVAQNAKHMLVICDTFDYDDYPVYTFTDEACIKRYNTPGEMQRVMEVYDLLADKDSQLSERIAMHLPEAPRRTTDGEPVSAPRAGMSFDEHRETIARDIEAVAGILSDMANEAMKGNFAPFEEFWISGTQGKQAKVVEVREMLALRFAKRGKMVAEGIAQKTRTQNKP